MRFAPLDDDSIVNEIKNRTMLSIVAADNILVDKAQGLLQEPLWMLSLSSPNKWNFSTSLCFLCEDICDV